jgi:hypothetical protein
MQGAGRNQVFQSILATEASLWRAAAKTGAAGLFRQPIQPCLVGYRATTGLGRMTLNPSLRRQIMADELDEAFYQRADAHIHLSNDQLDSADAGKVSASMMFATARFNAFISAGGFQSGEAMAAKRAETIEYFVGGYRQMLEAHLDEYIRNFDSFMKQKS